MNEDMFSSFKKRSESVSAEVHRFGIGTEAMDFVIQFLQNEGVADNPGSYAVWASCFFLKGIDREDLAKKIPGLKFEVNRELAKNAKIGITQTDYGLADTGTLVQDQTVAEQRLASSLVPIHIALLPTDNILPDLSSVIMKIHPDKSGFIAMITGPSRTADIERVLTIGVHGPERLVIICVDKESME